MRLVRSTIIISTCLLLTACGEPGVPSGQAVRAVNDLSNLKYAGEYMIGGFNPCGRPPADKRSSYNASVKLDRKGEIRATGSVKVSGTC